MKIIDIKDSSSRNKKNRDSHNIKDDEAILSSAAQIVRETVDLVKAMPAVDLKKAAVMKSMLQKGTYKVAAEKAASQMLTEALLWDR